MARANSGLGNSSVRVMAQMLAQSSTACPRAKANKKSKLYGANSKFSKKDAQDAAIAKDREFVLGGMHVFEEDPAVREVREQQFDKHWWEAMFVPIARPRELLPDAFNDRLPVPVPICHSNEYKHHHHGHAEHATHRTSTHHSEHGDHHHAEHHEHHHQTEDHAAHR